MIKGQKRSISHDNPNGSVPNLAHNEYMNRNNSKNNFNVNQTLLKQAKQPVLEKHLKNKSYLKYSAFSQLSNNKDQDRAIEFGQVRGSSEDSRSIGNNSNLRSSFPKCILSNEEL